MNSYIKDIQISKRYKEFGGIQRERISFKILDTIPIIPNYIRVAVKSGIIGVKVLTCDIDKIDSNDDRILRKDIADYRIKQIPLRQDTDINMVFTMEAHNDTMHPLEVYSDSIKPGGHFMPNLPILTLMPQSYIKIDRIYVTEGSYREGPAYSNCESYIYKTLDYVPVLYLSENGLIYTKHCYYKDLNDTEDNLLDKKILIIDKNYDESMEAYQEDCYDSIVRQDIKFYTGHEADIKDIYLSFDTYGTINPTELVVKSIRAIGDNLVAIKTAIESEDKFKVNIFRGTGIFTVTIKQDSKWTAELILQYAAQLSGEITVNYKVSNHSKSEVTIHILHSDGEKFLYDILNDMITTFYKLADSF